MNWLKWLMIGNHNGKQMIGIPIISVDRYLNMPREARWALHLIFGMQYKAVVAVFGPAVFSAFFHQVEDYLNALE